MKSLFKAVLYIAAALFLSSANSVFAATEYEAFISLENNGKVAVKENISFSEDRPFIRFLSRVAADGSTLLVYDDFSLQKNGKDLAARVAFTGDRLRVYAADDEDVGNAKGVKYVFSYTVSGAVKFGEKTDSAVLRLWNGDKRENDIAKASAVMVFPNNITVKTLLTDNLITDGSIIGGKAFFRRQYTAGKFGSFVVGAVFTKGIAETPTKSAVNPLSGARWLLVVIFAYYMIWWIFIGKDDESGEIVPLPRPVGGLSVGEAAVLFFGRYADMPKVITAALLDAAQSGHIRIINGDDDVISLQRTGCPEDNIHYNDDRLLIKRLFAEKDRIRLTSDDGKRFADAAAGYQARINRFAKRVVRQNTVTVAGGVILHMLISLYFLVSGGGSLLQMSLFSMLTVPAVMMISGRSRRKADGRSWMTAALLLAVFVAAVYSFYAVTFLEDFFVPGADMPLLYVSFTLLVMSATALHAVFYHLMDKPGAAAVRLLRKLGGTNEFISAPAEERDVELTQLMFEENWPYAVIFNNHQKWQNDYAAVNPGYRPEWAEGVWDDGCMEKLIAAVRGLYKNCGAVTVR